MQLLGSFTNPMGDRVATGLAATVIGTTGGQDSYYPVQGALLASGGVDDGKFLTTSGGDHIIYAID